MLMFCLSGLVLNHRSLVADADVSREWLPSRYEYHDWNGGLMRGTVPLASPDGGRVLVYGSGGMWLTDSTGQKFQDFNGGLPCGADHRQMRAVVTTRHGQLFAASATELYSFGLHGLWHRVPLPTDTDERLTDLTARGDTLVVLSRNNVYMSVPPYNNFRRITLPAPDDYDAKATAFRTVWLLHSGELFGTAGKIVVDIIALILILLCLTGLTYWLIPKLVKRGLRRCGKAMRWTYLLHDKTGRYTIVLTLLLCATGWCLRPPVMVPLVLNRIPTLPGTVLKSDNAWNDKLRMIRYDATADDWLLSTSEGFYSLSRLDGKPTKIQAAPPASVMGVNVLQSDGAGHWLCGSFSGMFVWDRTSGTSTDFFTHKPAVQQKGMPFGKVAVAGYSADFACQPFVVEYYKGTKAVAQPDEYTCLPMSLWNVALEVHSGRIYMGSIATYFFIFIAGLAAIWCLWSGFKIVRS